MKADTQSQPWVSTMYMHIHLPAHTHEDTYPWGIPHTHIIHTRKKTCTDSFHYSHNNYLDHIFISCYNRHVNLWTTAAWSGRSLLVWFNTQAVKIAKILWGWFAHFLWLVCALFSSMNFVDDDLMVQCQKLGHAWKINRGRTCPGEGDYYDILHKGLEHACILLSAGGFETNSSQLQNNYILIIEGDVEVQSVYQEVNSRHTILAT